MSSGKLVLPSCTAGKLKCDLCHGYLSIPPIYSYKDRHACGRCNPEWERNVIYEQLAQYMVFPCMYCDAGFAWEAMQSHEYKCKQNILLCPPKKQYVYEINGGTIQLRHGEYHKDCHNGKIKCPFHQCVTSYDIPNIMQHFNKHHKDYVFTNAVEAKKILKEEKVWNFNSDTQVCLLIMNTLPFLLFVHNDCDFDDSNGDILYYNYYFSVFTFCLKKCDMKYTVNLQISSSDSDVPTITTMKNQEIKTFNDKLHVASFLHRDLFKLNSFDIMTTKIRKIARTGKLIVRYSVKSFDSNAREIAERNSNKLDANDFTNIEKNFECPICKEYMMAPIYNCQTGHTICGNCRQKLTLCPYCQAVVGTSRNYVLEDILESLSLRCHNEYKGCRFVGKVHDTRLHEVMCHFN